MIIRTLRAEDIPEIKRITEEGAPYLAVYPDYMYWMFENLFSDICFIAEVDGAVAGFLTTLPVPKLNAIFAWQLGVGKDYRRQGVAHSLISAAWEKAEELQLSGIVTSIDPENEGSLKSFRKVASENGLTGEKIGYYETPGVFYEDAYLWQKK